MTIKKVWSTKELADRMNDRILMPRNPYNYNFLTYPHWALVVALHYGNPFSEDDLEHNLKLIESIPAHEALDVKYKTLLEKGLVV